MQSAQHRLDVHPNGNADSMPRLFADGCSRNERRVRQAWTQRHVWATAVVVDSPQFQNRTQMIFGQGYQPVEAIAPDRADQALADGVCFRTVRGRFQDSKSERRDGAVKALRKDRISIVKQVSTGVVKSNRLP